MMKFVKGISLITVSVLFFACSEEVPAPAAVKMSITPPLKSVDSAKETASEPEIKVQPYRYNPKGKRNPFASLIEDRETAAKASVKPLSALQKFDITQIKVTGVLQKKSGPAAIMITPDGQMHIVRIGEFIGKNFGQISSMTAGSIKIKETLLDFDGTERVREQEIIIKKGKDY